MEMQPCPSHRDRRSACFGNSAVTETRKLAAILVSDIVGYSRLAGTDEDRILARLRTLRSDLIDPTIAVHHGRIVKRTGDGSIVEFRSVVDAVRCAIEVQSGLAERNAGLPPEKRIEYRVGIHLGDVVEETDGDLMGDGVNIAARLEGVAKPGTICLSEDAYRQVSGRLEMVVTDLGPTKLKNIDKSIRAYLLQVGKPSLPRPRPKWRFVSSPLAVAIAALLLLAVAGGWYVLGGRLMKPPQAGHLSIVVLPFANLSGDPAQDYFADGITENLTTELSRIHNSFVIARNTAFTYKGKNIDAKAIGKELGVRYVLEGSVQRDGNRVRVNAQLVDAETGAHLWADRFEEDLADLFKLQDEVVARLGNSLGNELSKAEAEKGARSKNPDAIDLVMRANALAVTVWNGDKDKDKEANDAALSLFEQALRIDPENVDAMLGEAGAYITERARHWPSSTPDYEAKTLGQINRAIALAPDNVAGYDMKSWYLRVAGRLDEAVRAIDAGLAINPNDASLYANRAWTEDGLGRFEQAKSDVQQAMRLSPRDPWIGSWHTDLGTAELDLGQLDAAIEEFQKDNVGDIGAVVSLPAAYALAGRMDEAKSALARLRRADPELTIERLVEGHASGALIDGLRKAGLPEGDKKTD
jgi:TolB-like protein/class 3 adenylate cyclase/Tfp pilus assembly protein PilF